MKQILVVIVCSLAIFSCSEKKDYKEVLHNPLLYSNTVHELNVVVMGNNFSPIIASRNYLYAAIAGYETIAAGYPGKYYSLAGQVNGLKSIPKPEAGKAIDFEFASLLSYCKLGEAVTFPAGSMKEYVDSLKALAKDHGMPSEEFDNSIAFADTVSATIMAWSKKDNYAQTRSFPKYNVIDSPGFWVRTPPAYADAMEPHWKKIRTVVLDSSNQFKVPPPPPFNLTDTTSKYYQEVMAIKNAGDSLTDEQKHIAEFWDDNPFKLNVTGHVMFGTKKFSPPGHWMGIVGIAAKQANFDFASTAYAFAATAISLFDSFIFCWDEKYLTNYGRPESVINKYIDPEWRPFLQTPPFPEYLCGHSTSSATAAEVMTSVFGDHFNYTDTTELEFGIKSRSFNSFREAAVENNWARFYGGIHFHNSCIISTEYGKKVGDLIVQRLKFKK
ncbi:MAG: vanadium-dependent haloperoxidase [Chitinophagaceae bacterium]